MKKCVFLLVFLVSCVTVQKIEPKKEKPLPVCKHLLSKLTNEDSNKCEMGKPFKIIRDNGFSHAGLPFLCGNDNLVVWFVINSNDIREVDKLQRNETPLMGKCVQYGRVIYLYRWSTTLDQKIERVEL